MNYLWGFDHGICGMLNYHLMLHLMSGKEENHKRDEGLRGKDSP